MPTPTTLKPDPEAVASLMDRLLASNISPTDLALITAALGSLSKEGVTTAKGNLSICHDLSVNDRYGTSQVNVVCFALDEYYHARIKECADHVVSGDFNLAFEHYRDAQSAFRTIFELALDLSALADRNYWASIGETPKLNEAEHEAQFDYWMKEYLGKVPDGFGKYVSPA